MGRRVFLVALILAVVVSGGRADAHDPLFLTPEQTTPEAELADEPESTWAVRR